MTKRDLEILYALWRWKILSTAVVTELLFPDGSPSWAYRELLRLKREGLVSVTAIPTGNEDFRWLLTPRGFRTLKAVLPDLLQKGFRSEALEHDSLVSSIHLGNWIFGIPEGCSLFTEQELRRYHPDHFPEWVPKEGSNRPDGYWKTQLRGNTGVIALEVELNKKPDTEYPGIAQSYALKENLFRVVWIVKSPNTSNAIVKAVKEIGGVAMGLHCFLLLKAVKQLGWEAQFFDGRDKGRRLSDLLPSIDENLTKSITPQLLFNDRKSPHISKSYLELKKTLRTHRLGSSLVGPIRISDVPQNQTKGEHAND